MASFHPLFSTIATLYTLIFLYFPTIITFSPVLISASVLLLFLLKLGADQRISQEERTKEPEPKPKPENPSLPFSNNVSYHDDSIKCEMDSPVDPDTKPDPDIDYGTKASCETDWKTCSDTNCFIEFDREKCSGHDPNPDPSPFYGKCFMQWNVRAPFEVIYNDDCTNCHMDSVVDPNMKPDPVPDCFNEYNVHDPEFDPDPESEPFYGNCFVEWNVRAPLEVIYEAYEGEEEDDDDTEEKREKLLGAVERYTRLSMYKQQQQIQCDSFLSMYKQQQKTHCDGSIYKQQQQTQCNNISSKYKQQQQIQCNDESLSMYKQQQQQQTQYDVSLSMYYPETDTDSTSSDRDSPEIVCFRWDEEDKEGLIEIELDCKRNSEVEEENLIEIDLGFYMS